MITVKKCPLQVTRIRQQNTVQYMFVESLRVYIYTQQYTKECLKSANVKNNNESLRASFVLVPQPDSAESSQSAEQIIVLLHVKRWYRLFRRTRVLLAQHRFLQRRRLLEPRVSEQLGRCQSFPGFFSQQALQQTLGRGRQALWQTALTSADFGKQRGRVRVVEGVAANQHGVQHDPQAPHVGHLAGVRRRAAEDLWADVSGAAVGV